MRSNVVKQSHFELYAQARILARPGYGPVGVEGVPQRLKPNSFAKYLRTGLMLVPLKAQFFRGPFGRGANDSEYVGLFGLGENGKRNSRSLHYATPDFLSRLVALARFMRLPVREAAYVAAGGSAM
jgi:hypothetical protein